MIRIDDGKNVETAYGIWQRNFHDPILYAKFYFEEVYGKNIVYFNDTEDGEEVRGMLHLNPYTMVAGDQEFDLHYIVGVSTEEDYRRQGVMRELLHKSMSDMREKGEPFTYLMPADEDYYLPFDFRFGMNVIEQEIHYGKRADEEANKTLSFVEYKDYGKDMEGLDSIETICKKECDQKKKEFSLFTKITPDYLARMSAEMESDFGKLFFVFKDGAYMGRFVAAAEYSYLLISQIFCMEGIERLEFIRSVLDFIVDRFGDYGSYQLSFDESYEGDLLPGGPHGKNRLMPAKTKKKIMFRILNLEGMASLLKLKNEEEEEKHMLISLTDPFLTENTGIYEIIWKKDVRITRVNEEISEDKLDLSVDVALLTELLFGDKSLEEAGLVDNISEMAKDFFNSVDVIRNNCILEIV